MEFIKNIFQTYKNFKDVIDKEKSNKTSNKFIKSMRIYLTESCNANCSYCFNKEIRKESHMTTEKASKLFEYLRQNNVTSLKIMGGEPTVHPNFVFLYNLSQEKFQSVSIFTNALNNEITKIRPRNNDSIVYNFLFINKTFDINKFILIPDLKFNRVFEIVIDSQINIQDLKQRIDWSYEKMRKYNIKKFYFQITLNCIENIFKYQTIINNKFQDIIKYIMEKYPLHISFDHTIPFCFWEKESIDLMKKYHLDYYTKTCQGTDFGLIDANFNLLHCNQYQKNICSIFENDKIIDFVVLNNLLKQVNLQKKIHNIESRCKKCKYFDFICTGGCLGHK